MCSECVCIDIAVNFKESSECLLVLREETEDKNDFQRGIRASLCLQRRGWEMCSSFRSFVYLGWVKKCRLGINMDFGHFLVSKLWQHCKKHLGWTLSGDGIQREDRNDYRFKVHTEFLEGQAWTNTNQSQAHKHRTKTPSMFNAHTSWILGKL